MRTPIPVVHIAEIFPALQGRQKETVRLHPRQGGNASLSASKMGGLFLWPQDEPRPRCSAVEFRDVLVEDPAGSGTFRVDLSPIGLDDPLHNDHLVGVLQLRQEDVPEMVFYPGSDLFQLLWCPRYHPDDFTPFCQIYWRRAADVRDPRADAPRPRRTDDDDGFVPKPCILSPEPVIEYPWKEELPEALQEQIGQWETTASANGYLYHYDLSVASGTKVGGYYTSLDPPAEMPTCPTCQCRMDYLLTVASGEWGNGAGRERWCPEEERYLLGDDPSIDYRVRQAAVSPSVFLSRGYDLNLFICRRHSTWPIAWSY